MNRAVEEARIPDPRVRRGGARWEVDPSRPANYRITPFWAVGGLSILSLVVGLIVGIFVVPPLDAVSEEASSEAGFVTVPVEFGKLTSHVLVRADAEYADAVAVTIEAGDIQTPAVVTGQVPLVGAELGALAVALEVGGRPVIVLPGELPAYRTLRYGVSGPDVTQLKEALRTVGLDGGSPSSDVYDAQLAEGITQLYSAVGYRPPAPDEAAEADVRAAEETVAAARVVASAARDELARAASGPSPVELKQADIEVAAAQRALDAARSGDSSTGSSSSGSESASTDVAALQDALDLAQLRRESLLSQNDDLEQRAAVDAAERHLTEAQDDLARAQQSTLTSLPVSEVLYLQDLPRRVSAVNVVRGDVIDGPPITISSASLQLRGLAPSSDAELVKAGFDAEFTTPSNVTLRATVKSVAQAAEGDGPGRWEIQLQPEQLSDAEVKEVEGSNVRVSIPVGSTDGAVFSVPLAAVSAGQQGESRIQIVEGDPRDPAARTRLVIVETGLSAGGFVEINPLGGSVAQGDLVVVGR